MGNNVNNVSTGKPNVSGSIYYGPLTATIPTDAETELDEAFVCVGYISEDGVENDNTINTNDIKAWGGDIVLKPVTESTDDFKFTMIESKNVDALKAYFGEDNVTVDPDTGAITIDKTSADLPKQAWVIDQVLNDGRLKRLVIPNGQVTNRETITYKDEEAVGLGVTVTAYPYSGNKTHKEYIQGDITPSI